ncbi:MAG: hypothetical protein UW80_C0056G0005 [Microgenomates group bacterium GW2011_GWC1_44_9]|nr:MAG: hypothetical protein UW80_C0056G0005 [Microgenomates group bacterium GW2011_GWC1_44_9]
MSSKYTGPGEYYLKLKRYTGESTSGTYSDTLSITLSEVTPSPEPTPTSTPATPSLTTATPTVTNTPTSQPTSTPIKTNIPTKTPSPTPTPTKTPTPRPIASATPTKTITPSSSVIPAQAGIHQISQLSGSSSAQILGDSTTSGLVVEIVTPSVIARQSTLPTSFYKYTFIIGAILSALSGGWLYFRHKKD